MLRYVLRRLGQAVLTVFGVMLLTFVLFRLIAGDVSTAYVNQKLGFEARQTFYEKHKLDRPDILNFHRRFMLVDHTTGTQAFGVHDEHGSQAGQALSLHRALSAGRPGMNDTTAPRIVGRLVFALSPQTSLLALTQGKPLIAKSKEAAADSQKAASPAMTITLRDSTIISVAVASLQTCGDLMNAINKAGGGKLTAAVSERRWQDLFDSQFFWHLWENVTFTGKSYATNQTLLEIISQRGKYSLSLTVPAMVMSWFLGMVISCFVAYFRDTWVDRIGVLLTVLGICIPYLAYMLIGQWVMFSIAPEYAVGLAHPASIYVPVFIAVIAGLGFEVRFYRTIILDEINRDYVRTARAKGVPLASILFTHVLKNCMLPILTDLVAAIPFLILGALLLERFFGIPGLGDLMLTSITTRDVPIITGLTFLTAILYVISLLITDVLYAVFDPRIRLQ